MSFLTSAVAEYRRGLMNAFMDEHQLDALAFLTPDYFFYATNYFLDVAPWERPVVTVQPRNGDPFAIMHELSTNHLKMAKERATLWVPDVTLYSEHPRLANRLHLTPQWPALMAELLREHGLTGSRIGVDSLSGSLSVAQQTLSVTFVALERTLRELRHVKHPEELDLMRQAASLSDWAQERYREEIRPGRVVQEMDFSVAAQTAQEASARHPGEQVEIRCFSLSGPDSAAPHGTGTSAGKTVEKEHSIVNIVIIRVNGSVVENERTWFCGKPSDEQARAFDVATRAQQAAIEQMTTGNSLSCVDAAALSVIYAAGFGDNVIHRTGHGIGIAGHEFPDDMAFDPRPLKANEVYSAEPGIYIYGLGGFRHDDTVIVANTPEVVTKAPKDIESQTVA
ncbi:MAG: Xaa-Pro peptidase family protein [Nitrolancea sp.]